MTIRVIDPASNYPVDDAPVQVMVDDREIELTTNHLGEVSVDLADEDGPQYGVRVTASPQGYIPTSISWKRRELENLPEEYTLKLKRGSTIGGKVESETGTPIKGARVIITIAPARGGTERTYISNEEVRTDNDGQWRFHAAPENIESVRLRLEHPYYITNQYYDYGRGKERSIGPLKTLDDVIKLKQNLTLEGTVLDEKSQPVKGAKISTGGNAWTQGRKPSAISDSDGTFAFKDLEPSELTLSVEAEGYAPTSQKVTVNVSSPPVTIHLEPAAIIKGRVEDRKGNPVPDVSVNTSGWGGDYMSSWRSSTDREGRFEWTSAPHSEVDFRFYKEGYQSVSKKLGPSEEEHLITLAPPLVVSGTVEDAETGEPIPSFTAIEGIGWEGSTQTSWQRHNVVNGANGRYEIKFGQDYPRHLVRIEAEGYLPEISKSFNSEEGEQVWSVKLKKGSGPTGIVLSPEGIPLQGAEVFLCTRSEGLYLRNGRSDSSPNTPASKTEETGRFRFTPQVDPYAVVALHDLGVAEVSEDQLKLNNLVRLQPWGRVVGTVRVGSATGVDEHIALGFDQDYSRDVPRVSYNYDTTTDKQGRYSFDRVKPGEVTVSRMVISREDQGSRQMITVSTASGVVEAGTTVTIDLGGRGRAVVGKVVVPPSAGKEIDFHYGYQNLQPVRPLPFQGEAWNKLGPEEQQKKHREWMESAEGKAYRRASRNYSFTLNADGTFHIDDVESGTYELHVGLYAPPPGGEPWGRGEQLGTVNHRFVVPETPEGRSDEALDLGNLEVKVLKDLEVGDRAPDFVMADSEGKQRRLEDFRGKHVLLYFWHPQTEGATEDLRIVRNIYKEHSERDDLTLIRVTFGVLKAAIADSTEEERPNWFDMSLDANSIQAVAQDYKLRKLPLAILLDPEGKVLAKDLQGDSLRETAAKALGKGPP